MTAKDEQTLTIPRSLGLMGVILILLGISMLVIAWMIGDFTGKNLWTTSVLALIFIGSGCWMYVFYKNHYVRYNVTEITVMGMNKIAKRFSWTDISSMRASYPTRMIIVKLKSGEQVKFYWYLTGCDSLIEKINNHLSSK